MKLEEQTLDKSIKTGKIMETNMENKTLNKIYARKCNVVFGINIDDFLNNNHIQGTSKFTYTSALIYNEEIVAVIGIIKRGNDFELNRFASSTSVLGGFSKLLKTFKTC